VVTLRFLGTGPAGGRPGRGRSRRTESSLLIRSDDGVILIDVTRDLERQLPWFGRSEHVDLVLLTHAHRDASGGVVRLDRALTSSVPLVAARSTLRALRARHRRLQHLELRSAASRSPFEWRSWTITPLAVPHARDCTTFAWRLDRAGTSLVYASDIARLTPGLASLCESCDLLVLDGAMWRRRIFTHLEIRSTIPVVARWPVKQILLTQIGRSTPSHEILERWLHSLDPRIGAAYDGMELALVPSSPNG